MGRKKNKQLKKSISNFKVTNGLNGCKVVKNDSSSDEVDSSKENILQDKEVTNGQHELIFEKYHPDGERVIGREYYVSSLCQVCKASLEERVPCPKCQLVSYCCQDHRRDHWPTHADLCAAVVQLCQERRVDHIMQGAQNLSPDNFRTFRFLNMSECERKVERPMEKWEREMFIFPNVCGTCGEFNIKNLIVCKHCLHSGFCESHQTNDHDNWCEHLLRYKNIVKHQATSGVVYPSIPNCKIPTELPHLLGMEHSFKRIREYIDDYEFFELTDMVSYPLTAYHALFSLSNSILLNSKQLTLHIVGAESDFEVHKIEKWEYYILHLIPELKKLHIDFVGPELNVNSKTICHKVCNQCLKTNKSITFNFHNELYHTICKSPKFSKPNLICVFNPGLYRLTGFNGQDTWSPSVKAMLDQNCPMLITAYTHKEILLDVATLRSTGNVNLEIEPKSNPFSSLKPNLNFVSDEESPVIFKNSFYCVMQKV